MCASWSCVETQIWNAKECVYRNRKRGKNPPLITLAAVPDPIGLRALVRGCLSAVGLVALRDRSILELSPTAVALTGLRASPDAPVDFARVVERRSVDPALDLIAEGSLDALRVSTALSTGVGTHVFVSLRTVARDGNQAYAIALFTTSDRAASSTLDSFVASLAEFADPIWPMRRAPETSGLAETFPEFDDLTDRQQEILARLARGDRVPTISRGMHLAASTIRNHLTMLYRKVGVHSQAELIEYLHAMSPSPSAARGTIRGQ
jgi:DNA-binding CsgD family transcriptional regulator